MIFVLAGPSGAGKGTVAAAVSERVAGLRLSRSWTTRPRRVGEPPDAYVFVDDDTFSAAVEQDRFLEWAEVFGHRYGTPRDSIAARLPGGDDGGGGDDILLEIDVQGAAQVRARAPDAVVIFLEVPSRAEQERRLRARGDAPEVIARRLERADVEEDAGRAIADHVVVNDDLVRAVDEVAGIVAAVSKAQIPGSERRSR